MARLCGAYESVRTAGFPAGCGELLRVGGGTALGARSRGRDSRFAMFAFVPLDVPIHNAAFATPHLDVLAGDTVTWHNDSVRAHNVEADDGSFVSPRLGMSGTFGHRFDGLGVVAYHCELHPSMRGDVTVHRVLLNAPREPAAPGRPFSLTGRAAAGSSVAIEDGTSVVATATAGADGSFSASVRPAATTSYRAVASDGSAGAPVQVLVLDQSVRSRMTVGRRKITVAARVAPASPGATVVLQLRLKERFGWWPVRTVRVGADSRARFVVPRGRRVLARVLLTASDGATELARGATFRLR